MVGGVNGDAPGQCTDTQVTGYMEDMSKTRERYVQARSVVAPTVVLHSDNSSQHWQSKT